VSHRHVPRANLASQINEKCLTQPACPTLNALAQMQNVVAYGQFSRRHLQSQPPGERGDKSLVVGSG
jgi:hypothetical protein